MQVPVIDFAGFLSGAAEAKATTAKAINQACRDSGFFMLVNHGVEAALIEAAFASAAAFFDRAEADKAALSIDKSPCHRGWYGHGGEVLDAARQPEAI